MKPFSEKVFLQLHMPSEDHPVSDHKQIMDALEAKGYGKVSLPLHILRKLYPLCREANFAITVTLVYRETEWVVADMEAGDQTACHYGLAVDYGSTTIVMELVDVNTGKTLAQAKEVNGQTAYGTDILTRITYALEDPAHADDLQQATAETFHRLLQRLEETTGIQASRCPVMILSGNTTMIHFLLKLNAWTVFASPFAPVTDAPGWLWGAELGMDFEGLVYIIPAASNYIGGDIVSGMLKLELHKKEELSLFFDIGTNGELVIGNREWIVAGAGAAGPALEGYISRYGMRAAPGAIDTVKIDGGNLTYTTIDHKRAVGICGSGIIDLLAQMRLNGWVNIAGELEPAASDKIQKIDGEYVAVYATAEESAEGIPLYFSQTDIHQYLDTKAAAYTMIECILETAGCAAQDLSCCYLSGAFTAHSDLEAAITIGVFPDLPREKYVCISNTSLEGARALLLDREKRQEIQKILENIYCLQFASVPDFLVRMQGAKFIPHTDMDRYPTIRDRLNRK